MVARMTTNSDGLSGGTKYRLPDPAPAAVAA